MSEGRDGRDSEGEMRELLLASGYAEKAIDYFPLGKMVLEGSPEANEIQ